MENSQYQPIITPTVTLQTEFYGLHLSTMWEQMVVYLDDALEVFNHLSYLELCVLPVVLKAPDPLVDGRFTFQVSCVQ